MKVQNICLSTAAILLSILSVSAHAEQMCDARLPQQDASRFTFSTDGTEVTDSKTGLIWQRCTIGQTWDGSTCSGEATNHATWKDALIAAKAVGNGYRLPNIKEYPTIVDHSCKRPAVNTSIFPGIPKADMGFYTSYWTSTPILANGSAVIVFDFNEGQTIMQSDMMSKSYIFGGMMKGYARAVRNK